MARKTTRVLVVDDERFFRELISGVLEREGVPFVLAENGEQALAQAADERIGVVLLDIELPDMNGLEVFSQLRDKRPELRVLIISSHTSQEYVLEALRLGAFDYLAKPIHEEELGLAVRRAVDTFGVSNDWNRLRRRLRALEATLAGLWAGDRETQNADELRETAVRAVADLLDGGKSSLMLLDEDAGSLHVAAAHGHEMDASQMDSVPVGEGVAGLALERSEPFLVEDVAVDERFPEREGRYESGSFAVAPLAAGARKLGVLCVTDPTGGEPFDEEDLSLLRIIASQLSALITANAEPLDAALPDVDLLEADLAAEEPLDAGDAELARLVCDAVTAEVEPQRILDAAVRPVAAALRAAPVSIYLLENGALVRQSEHDGGLRGDRASLTLGRGLTGTVAETGQLVASAEPSADPRFDDLVDTPEDGIPSPLLCGPLRFRGKTLGVFRVFPEAGTVPSAETGEVLSAALSAAVRNVLLYRSLVETIEEVARARREGQPS